MRSAQLQQAIDPTEVGIEPEPRDSGSGYKRIAQEVFSRIEERLGELKNKAADAQPPVHRASSLGRLLLRSAVVVLLVIGVAGAAIAYEWPRSEMVRQVVMQSAPQFVVAMLPPVDGQDAYNNDATAQDPRQTYGGGGVYRTDNDEANGGPLSPMQQQQLIQKLVQDVATLQQGMDQLRAGQDQMLRMMLRNPAQNAQARAVVAPPRPLGTTGLATPGGLNPAPPAPRRPNTSILAPPPRY